MSVVAPPPHDELELLIREARVPALIPGPLDHDVGPPTIGFTALTPNDWVAQNWSRLLVTTDAGRSWRVIRPAGLPHRWVVVGAGFTSLRDGWALFAAPPAPGFIPMRTTDGGRHWAPAGPWLPKRHRR